MLVVMMAVARVGVTVELRVVMMVGVLVMMMVFHRSRTLPISET